MRSERVKQPRVLSQSCGRVRIHLPGWDEDERGRIEARLRQVPGVVAIQANPLTGNVLILYAPGTAQVQQLLAVAQDLMDSWPVVSRERLLLSSLAKAGVRGMLGHAVVDALFFASGFLGSAAGLPLSALGPLHVLLDFVVWTAAMASAPGQAPAAAVDSVPGIDCGSPGRLQAA